MSDKLAQKGFRILILKTSSDAHFLKSLEYIQLHYSRAVMELLIHAETTPILLNNIADRFSKIYEYPYARGTGFDLGQVRKHHSEIFAKKYDLLFVLMNNENGEGYNRVIDMARRINVTRYVLLNINNNIQVRKSLRYFNMPFYARWESLTSKVVAIKNVFLPNDSRITILQLPVIDICNSHCCMCNVWRNRKSQAISDEQYRKILSNPFLRHVKSVGINGGEPTLRDDLVNIVKIVTECLPELTSVYITTNGFQNDRILDMLEKVFSDLQEKNVSLNVSISLDGDECAHDLNRGLKGSYAACTQLVQSLIKKQIPVWVAATLTKKNLYAADDVVAFAKKTGIPYRVRLGVDINRLNNSGFFDSQQYDALERFHLIQFFQKLYAETKNLFYYSLFQQLAYGRERIVGCCWRHNGVTIDSLGNLSFCSVSSPIVGSCLSDDIRILFNKNKNVRREILRAHCRQCMHDLSGPVEFKGIVAQWERNRRYMKMRKTIHNRIYRSFSPFRGIPSEKKLKDAKCVIITGWWGTETQGDKAILGELFHFLRLKAPDLREVYITAYPEMEYVVDLTIRELKETDIVDVSAYRGTLSLVSFAHTQIFKRSDFIIMGGGPIQQINVLAFIEEAFVAARKQGKGTFIFGCGINPVLGDYEPLVRNMLLHAQYFFFRDKESLVRYQTLTQKYEVGCFACDPAIAFVDRWKKRWQHIIRAKGIISTLVRANTAEYLLERTRDEVNMKNDRANCVFAQALDVIPDRITMLAMHSLWLGGDDRINNRQIAAKMQKKTESYAHKIMSLHELLTHVAESKYLIVSRYHAHLFAVALNIPFLSVDYAGEGNKIDSLLKRLDMKSYSLDWRTFQVNDIEKKIKDIDRRRDEIKQDLHEKAQALGQSLVDVYKVFD